MNTKQITIMRRIAALVSVAEIAPALDAKQITVDDIRKVGTDLAFPSNKAPDLDALRRVAGLCPVVKMGEGLIGEAMQHEVIPLLQKAG